MKSWEPIALTREVEAIQIPYGQKEKLPAGSQVLITQTLGGSFTVETERGLLVRIEGKDAAALGKECALLTDGRFSASPEPFPGVLLRPREIV